VPSDRIRNALQMPSVVKSCGSRRDDDLRYANVQTVCVHDADISARNLAVCRAWSRVPARAAVASWECVPGRTNESAPWV
jgi:hypothetical protein